MEQLSPGTVINVGGYQTQIINLSHAPHHVVIARRDHPVHPYATWLQDPVQGSLYSGNYWESLDQAEADFIKRSL